MRLTRYAYLDNGTYSWFECGEVRLYTIERPWINNEAGISCIPIGEYECKPRRFYSGGYDAIEVRDVPGRTHILFHVANFPHQVKGCLGVNSSIGPYSEGLRGFDSRKAFDLFMLEYGDGFDLEIVNYPGGIL